MFLDGLEILVLITAAMEANMHQLCAVVITMLAPADTGGCIAFGFVRNDGCLTCTAVMALCVICTNNQRWCTWQTDSKA